MAVNRTFVLAWRWGKHTLGTRPRREWLADRYDARKEGESKTSAQTEEIDFLAGSLRTSRTAKGVISLTLLH